MLQKWGVDSDRFGDCISKTCSDYFPLDDDCREDGVVDDGCDYGDRHHCKSVLCKICIALYRWCGMGDLSEWEQRRNERSWWRLSTDNRYFVFRPRWR
jgi:hypothetical protein